MKLGKQSGVLFTNLVFLLTLTSIITFFAVPCSAEKVFNMALTTAGDTQIKEYDNFEDMLVDLEGATISNYFPTYSDPDDPLYGNSLFRGLPMSISSDQGSTALTLSIPDIGFIRTFQGRTRDDSLEGIKEWFKSGDELGELFKKLAEETPTDPIAGNPNSLMARMAGTAYETGFFNQVSLLNPPKPKTTKAGEKVTEQKTANPNLAVLAATYGSFEHGPYKSTTYTLPLAYAIRFPNADPRQMVIIQLPLTYIDLEGSESVSASFGVSYTHPLADFWVITPGLNWGAVVSRDLASAGHIGSGTLTSAMNFPISDFRISLGNMGGYYRTIPIETGDYSVDPEIAEIVARNGLMLFIPTYFIYPNSGVELFGIDTRYFGDKLFNDKYQDVGFSLGYTHRHLMDIRIGATFTFADDNDGFRINFGYTF